MSVSFICNNIQETDNIAEKFASLVADKGAFVCLLGDVGAGKTAFT